MAAFAPATSDDELDSQMRALGVPMDQRKRIIAAARLGVPNPLKQLGLSFTATTAIEPPPYRPFGDAGLAEGQLALPASGAPTPPSGGLAERAERLLRARQPPVKKARKADNDEPDLDGFLAGGRAATAAKAKAVAAEKARHEQAAKERAERERQRQAELEREREAERRRIQEEREREEEEKRRQERRQARKEEKQRRREEKKRQRALEGGVGEEEDNEPDTDDEDLDRRQRDNPSSRGFFSQAYKGNQEQKRLWSEPIKGQVSNNYRGFTDADLDRRFGPPGGQSGTKEGPKLMTEEEVLALLRKGKSK